MYTLLSYHLVDTCSRMTCLAIFQKLSLFKWLVELSNFSSNSYKFCIKMKTLVCFSWYAFNLPYTKTFLGSWYFRNVQELLLSVQTASTSLNRFTHNPQPHPIPPSKKNIFRLISYVCVENISSLFWQKKLPNLHKPGAENSNIVANGIE